MHKIKGDKSGYVMSCEKIRSRVIATVFLAVFELLSIMLTLWFVSGQKIMNTGSYIPASSYTHTVPSSDNSNIFSQDFKNIIIYCSGIEAVTVVMFGSAIYFKERFFSERTVRQKKDELNTKLVEAEENARQASAAKSRFLSGMSHEIRTPINAIMGMTQLAIINIHDEKCVKYSLNMINQASGHLLLLVNDVLDIGRIESGKAVINRTLFNINNTLKNCISMTRGQLQNRNIDFVTKFDDFPYTELSGDELHLSQILINILTNAVKYTPDGGKVTFRASNGSTDGYVTELIFVIEDTGIGMSPGFMEHIWEPFAQETQKTSVRQGTGLGLSIVKKYVDLMNGTIDVESRQGKGSRFTVKLYFEINSSVCGETKTAENVKLNGMKVLLAEDNMLNKEVEKALLETQGVDVDLAENGQMAVNMFTEKEEFYYDAILMDVMMPVMDGITATEKIRASGRKDSDSTPIIAMTANAFDEDVKIAKEAGMNEHISKPIDYYSLFSTLGKYRKA